MIDARSTRCTPTGDENKFLEVTYQNGDKEVLFFKDFSSGAMIENIVRRAKKLSIKRTIAGGDQRHRHAGPPRLDQAGVPRARGPAEHHEPRRLGEDLRKKGERIVYVRTIIGEDDEARVDGRSSGSRLGSISRRARIAAVPAIRPSPTPPVGWTVAVPKICGIETEYGVSLRGAPDPNPVLARRS